MKLENRNVVITGAGSGIGRACAIEFAKEGANVVVADINLTAAKDTVEQINKLNRKAIAVEADVSVPSSVENLAAQTISAFGSAHALVNNAAIQVNKTIEDTTFEEWNRQLSINLGGVFLCSKYFLPHLRGTRAVLSTCLL
jgi:NAD(P)-dependent dehydrogenase (short-subunit alcohol dehydrogenase family)